MNCRGLTELVVLNVGLDLGVLTPQLFTMFVLMALVTTVMTSPLLQWLQQRVAGSSPEDRDATVRRAQPSSREGCAGARGDRAGCH